MAQSADERPYCLVVSSQSDAPQRCYQRVLSGLIADRHGRCGTGRCWSDSRIFSAALRGYTMSKRSEEAASASERRRYTVSFVKVALDGAGVAYRVVASRRRGDARWCARAREDRVCVEVFQIFGICWWLFRRRSCWQYARINERLSHGEQGQSLVPTYTRGSISQSLSL
jgi:hypothetical protein